MSEDATSILIQFDDNSLLPALFGEHDRNLARLEQELAVSISSRGNRLAISGPAEGVETARSALNALYQRLKQGLEIDPAEVDAAVRMARAAAVVPAGGASEAPVADDLIIRTRKRQITPRSQNQARYIAALRQYDLVFGLGPAGTGKTYLAVATGLSMLLAGRVERIILSRPAVEAGERLGFLPGDLREKVDPYLRPLYDALYDMLPGDQVIRRLGNGEIEVAPIAFMRGRTLANSYIILDEAQNTTPVQMKMFLTRLGENSRMVITGDPSQVDLPEGALSGLRDAATKLAGIAGAAYVYFTDVDVVRHPLVTRIVRAYDEHERTRGSDGRPSES
ncbi:MAG: PhoH family protein [Proteobacteria bacterium]|nr:PhoH family protein [Pseudomonadota bacterium]